MKEFSVSALAARACSMELAQAIALDIVEQRRHMEDCLETVLDLKLVDETNRGEQLIPMHSKLAFAVDGVGAFRHVFLFSPGGIADVCWIS